MAHSMVKPYSLLLYFLAFIASFFAGISYAGLIEAGKGQMLAGGAIVLGYGVIGAIVGFCVSLFVAYKTNRKTIFRINIVLGISIIAFWAYFFIKFKNKQNEKIKEETEQPIKTRPSKTVTSDNSTALLIHKPTVVIFERSRKTGLGMFKPNFFENKVLYFYGNPNLDKGLSDHRPTDSITFKKSEYGGFDILTAPPWLVPDHLKLDYDILYFRVQSIANDFLEIIVNTTNDQTMFVDRYSGKTLHWPEFLLSVSSVEFVNPDMGTIHIKPLTHAAKINVEYSFMKPLRVTNKWMNVELVDDNYNFVGRGWIKWIEDGKLLIEYSLLS